MVLKRGGLRVWEDGVVVEPGCDADIGEEAATTPPPGLERSDETAAGSLIDTNSAFDDGMARSLSRCGQPQLPWRDVAGLGVPRLKVTMKADVQM